MTSRSVGIALAVMVMLAGVARAEEPTIRRFADGDVAYTVTRSDAKIMLLAEGRGARLEKSAAAGGVNIRVSSAHDAFEIVVSNRTIRVLRGSEGAVVQLDRPQSPEAGSILNILRRSDASQALGRLAAAVDRGTRPEAASVLATFALVRALEGDMAGNRLFADKLRRTERPFTIRQAAQRTREDPTVVESCWEEYQRTLDRNLARYDACLREYWWAQPVQYACGLEFAMVAELAMFRLISCVGGMPVG